MIDEQIANLVGSAEIVGTVNCLDTGGEKILIRHDDCRSR